MKTCFFGHISPDLTPLPPTQERQKCGENDSEHSRHWVKRIFRSAPGKAETVRKVVPTARLCIFTEGIDFAARTDFGLFLSKTPGGRLLGALTSRIE